MKKEIKICQRCKKQYTGYPALSRKDNKTEICSSCGVMEALEEYTAYMKGPEKNDKKTV